MRTKYAISERKQLVFKKPAHVVVNHLSISGVAALFAWPTFLHSVADSKNSRLPETVSGFSLTIFLRSLYLAFVPVGIAAPSKFRDMVVDDHFVLLFMYNVFNVFLCLMLLSLSKRCLTHLLFYLSYILSLLSLSQPFSLWHLCHWFFFLTFSYFLAFPRPLMCVWYIYEYIQTIKPLRVHVKVAKKRMQKTHKQ